MNSPRIYFKQMAQQFGVSETFIGYAVSGKRNSELARRIRYAYGQRLINLGKNISEANKPTLKKQQ